MKRCSYCGKKINGSVGFCSDACESRYKKVMEKDGPKVKYFISGIILGDCEKKSVNKILL